jgi:pentose-5-phosphate-3-epimerase
MTGANFECNVRMPDPKSWIEGLKNAGVNTFTFHLEDIFDSDEKVLADKIFEMSNLIKEANMKVGISFDVTNDAHFLMPFLEA